MGSERPSAETTPAVTEPLNPFGLPIATTSWPTRSCSASPRVCGDQVAPIGPQDREVGERVGADHLEFEVAAIGEGGGPVPVGPGDDVGGAEHEAVGADRDSAAGPHPATASRRPAADGEVGDRGTEPLGDPGDGPRIGVEGFGIRQALMLGRGVEAGIGS